MLENFENKEQINVSETTEIADTPLTKEESDVYNNTDSSSAKELLNDDKKLSVAEKIAASTDAIEGSDGDDDYAIEGGQPCKGGGCDGSSWCYGCSSVS